MLKIPKRGAYQALDAKGKLRLTQEIGWEAGAEWKGMAHFALWGQELDTAVYEHKGGKFVFVPGDTVTLGWDGFPAEGSADFAALKAALDEDVQEYWGGQYQTEEILRKLTTPLRTVNIPPMLVERETHPYEDGRPIAMDELELTEAGKQRVEEFQASSHTILVMDTFTPGKPKLRLTKGKNGVLSAEIIFPDTREDLLARLETEGFTLPDWDQWEYLCGGGCQSLFTWGDKLPPAGKRQPNFFGLTIADNSWHREIVRSDGWWFRGGDGGDLDCYGPLQILNDFVCSPHFNGWYGPEHQEEMEMMLADGLSSKFDYYRRVVLLKNYD